MCVKEGREMDLSHLWESPFSKHFAKCLCMLCLRGGEKTHSPWWSTCFLLGPAASGSEIGNYFLQAAPVVTCFMVFSFMAGDLYLST